MAENPSSNNSSSYGYYLTMVARGNLGRRPQGRRPAAGCFNCLSIIQKGRYMMALFQKQRPIDKFNANYHTIKLGLFKMILDNQPEIETAMPKFKPGAYEVVMMMCVEYLLGEDIKKHGPAGTAEARKIRTEMAPKIPTLANKFYNWNKMDEAFSAILDYKDEKLTELLGDEWTKTAEAKRVRRLITSTPASIEETDGYKETWQWLNNM